MAKEIAEQPAVLTRLIGVPFQHAGDVAGLTPDVDCPDVRPREPVLPVARAVLPEGLTMSRMYVNGTIRSWIHYLEVRTDPSTQKEHREVALACAQAIADIFPMIMNSIHHAEESRSE
jgi:hypothetical protein